MKATFKVGDSVWFRPRPSATWVLSSRPGLMMKLLEVVEGELCVMYVGRANGKFAIAWNEEVLSVEEAVAQTMEV